MFWRLEDYYKRNMNRKFKISVSILVLAILIAAGVLAFGKYFSKPAAAPEATSSQPEVNSFSTTTPQVANKASNNIQTDTLIPGFRLYKNADFGFEIQYPATWMVSEEDIVNVRGENTKAFYFRKSGSDLRFAILPRDGLSYGLSEGDSSSEVMIGGSQGIQRKWTLPDGRRLWLLNPQYGLYNWSQDIGRIDIESSATDPVGDTRIFEEMLSSFKLKF